MTPQQQVEVTKVDRDAAAVHCGWTCYQSAALFASPDDMLLCDNFAYALARHRQQSLPYRNAILEEAAKVAEEAADSNADREASALIAAEQSHSGSGREVEIEYAVGYAKCASAARSIAARIRALKTDTTLAEGSNP